MQSVKCGELTRYIWIGKDTSALKLDTLEHLPAMLQPTYCLPYNLNYYDSNAFVVLLDN